MDFKSVCSDYILPIWSIFEDKNIPPHTSMHFLEDAFGIYAYAIVKNKADDVGHYIHKFEVRQDCRRQGIGKRLLEYLLKKYQNLWLEPLSGSYRFYLKSGAKPFARHESGWIFAINKKLPSENWSCFFADGKFCDPPHDDFVYIEDEWCD